MALSAPVVRKMAEKMAPAHWEFPKTFYLREIKSELRRAHLLIEVRDARIPFSSANLEFQRFLKWRPHMVVFTKSDLADPFMIDEWKSFFGDNYYFVNGYGKESVYRLTKLVKEKLRTLGDPMEKIKVVMLVGMPNVGKTTLANTMLRLGRWNVLNLDKFNLGTVDMEPYTTKTIADMKINYDPPMYVLDTPPVMVQRLPNLETGMKLALTGAVHDDVVGPVSLAHLILATLNQYPEAFHTKWKAQYMAHVFISKTRDKTKKSDRKLMGCDDHSADIRGVISMQFLHFQGDLKEVDGMENLVNAQFDAVREYYQSVSVSRKKLSKKTAACRIVSLYRVGKLGWHTLDTLPKISQGR